MDGYRRANDDGRVPSCVPDGSRPVGPRTNSLRVGAYFSERGSSRSIHTRDRLHHSRPPPLHYRAGARTYSTTVALTATEPETLTVKLNFTPKAETAGALDHVFARDPWAGHVSSRGSTVRARSGRAPERQGRSVYVHTRIYDVSRKTGFPASECTVPLRGAGYGLSVYAARAVYYHGA